MGKNNWNGPSLRQPHVPRKTRKNPFTQQRTPNLYRQRKRRRSLMPRRLRAFLRLLAVKLQDIVFLTRYAAHIVLFLVVILGSLAHETGLTYVLQLGPSLANASSADATLWQTNRNPENIYLTWENLPVSLINEQPAAARSQSISYQVREGDNPQTIADRFGLDPTTVIWANTQFEENPYLLELGQTLLLPPVDGVLHTIQLGDSLSGIAAAYQVDQQAIAEYASNNLTLFDGEPVAFIPGQQLIVPGGVKSLPDAQQDQAIVNSNAQPLDQGNSTGREDENNVGAPIGPEGQNDALALGSSQATSTLIAFPTRTPTLVPAFATQIPTLAPISATQVPVRSIAVESTTTGTQLAASNLSATSTLVPTFIPPTATRVPPTATRVPPTWTRVPPTWTRVPPTWTRVPPTWTRVPPTRTPIPPTLAPFEPTWTSVPPTWTSVPPTWTRVPPTWTSVPPTWTSVPPTWTSVPPTWTSVPPTPIFEPTWTSVPPTPIFEPTWTPIPTYTSVPIRPTSTPAPAITSNNNGCCSWPMSGRITTQPSSWHMALDILGPHGIPVRSAGWGYIAAAGWDNTGYGYRVIVNHGGGITTLYAHLSSISVGYGDQVRDGQTVGLLGSTGRSTAPHLHFEVRQNGYRQNPYSWLP